MLGQSNDMCQLFFLVQSESTFQKHLFFPLTTTKCDFPHTIGHGSSWHMSEVNFVVSSITMNKISNLYCLSHTYVMSCGLLCQKNPTFCCNGYLQGISKKRMLVVVGIPFFEIVFLHDTHWLSWEKCS